MRMDREGEEGRGWIERERKDEDGKRGRERMEMDREDEEESRKRKGKRRKKVKYNQRIVTNRVANILCSELGIF